MNSSEVQILCLYNETQTYTETVFEHLNSFQLYSKFNWKYLHWEHLDSSQINLSVFHAVVVHYSVRLPYDQISNEIAEKLITYEGPKVLFIQDEYDNTNRAKYWIKTIGFDLIFTVVPEKNLHLIYKPEEFPSQRFVSVLTGYIPSGLIQAMDTDFIPPSQRSLVMGYRGRPLPSRYGALGQEKVLIGKKVKDYCLNNNIDHDIAWSEEERIYGADWYKFVKSCKAMLGSESGSNVFDWDGVLDKKVRRYKQRHWFASQEELYQKVILPLEKPGLMNQVSPRIFEMAFFRTAMVLFEGSYSGVIYPDVHFIALKKDFSNLEEVFEQLKDDKAVDEMTSRAYSHVVLSEKFHYLAFIRLVDDELNKVMTIHCSISDNSVSTIYQELDNDITTIPRKVLAHKPDWIDKILGIPILGQILVAILKAIPISFRPFIKKLLGR